MQFSDDYRKIIWNYRNLTWIEKFIIWVRFKTVPIKEIIEKIPLEGKILDLGCGFGIFSYFLAQKYPKLEVTGVDPSAERIKVANNVFLKPGNLRFYQGEIKDLVEGDFDAIFLIDVEYLLLREELIEMLRQCYEKIRPGGVLIIKTMNRGRRFRHLLAISTPILISKILSIFRFKIFGFRKGKPHYYDLRVFKKILKEAGWRLTETHDLPMKLFIYPHIIYFCKKS
jgi:2-polyprenyl-6-hydroxyphenyl methylase/3-demethylubiquinone-9 3-methyltransferase